MWQQNRTNMQSIVFYLLRYFTVRNVYAPSAANTSSDFLPDWVKKLITFAELLSLVTAFSCFSHTTWACRSGETLKHVPSWVTYEAFWFPTRRPTISVTRILGFQFVRKFTFSLPNCKNVIEKTHELNNAQHIVHHTAHNTNSTAGTGLCNDTFGSTGSISDQTCECETLLIWSTFCGVRNNPPKNWVFIDQVHKLGHFWKIEKSPALETIEKPNKGMPGKSQTYGIPNGLSLLRPFAYIYQCGSH